jgi:hypothetical protein
VRTDALAQRKCDSVPHFRYEAERAHLDPIRSADCEVLDEEPAPCAGGDPQRRPFDVFVTRTIAPRIGPPFSAVTVPSIAALVAP